MNSIYDLRIREHSEANEAHLSRYASKSYLSRGREIFEEPCAIRTAFQRDRDRILHSKAFRRLKHKTQVFIAPLGDHYVTRLTHTLEVSQLSRTIARALNLNEDLCEAMSLGHDLGHTPFGHIGEEVLNKLYPPGFHHNEQSLRVVDILEKNGLGLNLTWEVRDGILNHSKARDNIFTPGHDQAATLEGRICQIADAIAYINHDIGDAIRAGLFTEADLPQDATCILGHTHSSRINTMVQDIVVNSWNATGLTVQPHPDIRMSQDVEEASNLLRSFLFANLYNPQLEQPDAQKARIIIDRLYHYLVHHPESLPPEYKTKTCPLEQNVVDYIAGMTDQYAIRLAESLSLSGY